MKPRVGNGHGEGWRRSCNKKRMRRRGFSPTAKGKSIIGAKR